MKLSLGVDIGTTSVSAQLIDIDAGNIVETMSENHEAGIAMEGFPDAFAQDAEKLLARVLSIITNLCGRYPISAIGITGQMHGIVCLDQAGHILSPLYTWQNQFGARQVEDQSITEEIKTLSGFSIPTGYGFATLYALKRLQLLPEGTAQIATIMDLTVMRLCGLSSPLIHPTNAAGLGAYELSGRRFDREALSRLGIASHFLPCISEDYALAGAFRGIPVAAAIGDNQAGTYGALRDETQVLMNLGTSGQISLIAQPEPNAGGEDRPWFNGKVLRSGATLCGGSAYAALADFFCGTAAAFGKTASRGDIYAWMNQLAETPVTNPLRITTCFAGTRADSKQRGAIDGLGLENFTPAHFVDGVLNGILRELADLYQQMTGKQPQDIQTVAVGNALRKNQALRKRVEHFFGRPSLLTAHREEAAFGAALFAGVCSGLCTEQQARTLIHYLEEK